MTPPTVCNSVPYHHAEGHGQHPNGGGHPSAGGQDRQHVRRGVGRVEHSDAAASEEENAADVRIGAVVVHHRQRCQARDGQQRTQHHHRSYADLVGQRPGRKPCKHIAHPVRDECNSRRKGIHAEGALQEEDHVVDHRVACEGHQTPTHCGGYEGSI